MKIIGGYYIKARKIQESKITHCPPYIREIWDWLIKEANHERKKYRGFVIERGQLFRTYKEIREGLHWMVGYRKMMYNENQTKKAMKFLRESLMITTAKELGGVLITICKYDYYQDHNNYKKTNEGTNEGTNAEPMENHPIPDTNKHYKELKNEKELIRREIKFEDECLTFEKKYSEDTVAKFIKYWTELNSSRKKMRFELQPTFEIGKRLGRWSSNDFGKKTEPSNKVENKFEPGI